MGATLVVVVLAALAIGPRMRPASKPQQLAPDTWWFSIRHWPTLVFNHFIGNVHLTLCPDRQVSIKEMRNGETNAIRLRYAQHGDTIVTTTDIPGGLLADAWVDFDVIVPAHVGLVMTIAIGTLEATGLSGRIELSNTNGARWATGPAGSIRLKTQSWSSTRVDVAAQVVATTENGTITARATRRTGQSALQAVSRTIDFQGAVSHTGSATIKNSNDRDPPHAAI